MNLHTNKKENQMESALGTGNTNNPAKSAGNADGELRIYRDECMKRIEHCRSSAVTLRESAESSAREALLLDVQAEAAEQAAVRIDAELNQAAPDVLPNPGIAGSLKGY